MELTAGLIASSIKPSSMMWLLCVFEFFRGYLKQPRDVQFDIIVTKVNGIVMAHLVIALVIITTGDFQTYSSLLTFFAV